MLNDLVLSGESWLLADVGASKDTTTKLDLEHIQESLLIDPLFLKDYHLSVFQFPLWKLCVSAGKTSEDQTP